MKTIWHAFWCFRCVFKVYCYSSVFWNDESLTKIYNDITIQKKVIDKAEEASLDWTFLDASQQSNALKIPQWGAKNEHLFFDICYTQLCHLSDEERRNKWRIKEKLITEAEVRLEEKLKQNKGWWQKVIT